MILPPAIPAASRFDSVSPNCFIILYSALFGNSPDSAEFPPPGNSPAAESGFNGSVSFSWFCWSCGNAVACSAVRATVRKVSVNFMGIWFCGNCVWVFL